MDVAYLKSHILHLKILIRLPNWLGDVVMSTAFVNAVKQYYPGAVVDAVIKKELAGVAQLITGLNKIHLFSRQEYPGLGGAYCFGKILQAERYNLYFNLPHSLSANVMAWASRAKYRVGFAKEGGFFLMTHAYKKPLNLHRVDEYVSLLAQYTGKRVSGRQVKLSVTSTPDAAKKYVIINFNSEADSRRMPIDKGRSILNNLTKNFRDTVFMLIGAAKEAAYVTELLYGLPNTGKFVNYAGKTDLAGLTGLMAGAKAVLTTDSGPAHLANSISAPVIVLFGAGNELNTAPYNQKDLIIIRYGKLNCEPCIQNTCRLYGVPKCMEMLEESRIINALSLYL